MYPVEAYFDADTATIRHRARGNTCAGNVLAIVVDAVSDGQWRRLRACPGASGCFTTGPRI